MSAARTLDVGRLGSVDEGQLEAALERFELGSLRSASAVPFGLFGQNVFVESSSGSYVLRFGAHSDWQFPTEQRFCRLIHERTAVPVPWPYLWEPSGELFGFPWGYVLMPRLPGIATADPAAYALLTLADRAGVARALGGTLRELQTVSAPASGTFDHRTGGIEPFPTTYLQRSIDRLLAGGEALSGSDRRWLEGELDAAPARADAFDPVLCHGDYNTNNASFERDGDGWRVSGVFDLMTAHFGDGHADAMRQLSMFAGDDPGLATLFLATYLEGVDVDDETRRRLRVYLLDERMVVWDFFHQPDWLHLWNGGDVGFRAWFGRYGDALDTALG
jgi:aminoglycoside phosphotransferase (APT) family kinase protein